MASRGACVCLALLLVAGSARAEELTGTLTLDAFSFVSFEDLKNLPIQAGSTIRFRFGEPEPDGSIPFTIQALDVRIEPIAVDRGTTLHYGLAAPATGSVRMGSEGAPVMTLTAKVTANLSGLEHSGTATYTLHFTTEEASAANLAGTRVVTVQGVRPTGRFVQLVGAMANPADAYPEPGKAVYAVLSGTFDVLPSVK